MYINIMQTKRVEFSQRLSLVLPWKPIRWGVPSCSGASHPLADLRDSAAEICFEPKESQVLGVTSGASENDGSNSYYTNNPGITHG